jgi:hypothetical protein
MQHNALALTAIYRPPLRLNTLPALDQIRVPLALVHVLPRIPAVRALKLDTQRDSVVDVLRPDQRLRRIPLFNPIHKRHEDIALRLIRADLITRLPDGMSAVAATTVARAADSEVAVECVELRRRQLHGIGDVMVVARRILRRDDGVHAAVPVQDLGAVGGGAEVARPGLDVERVDAGCVVEIGGVQRRGVPGWVVVDGVAEPVGRVGEGVAAEEDDRGEDLSAGLQARVDEVAGVVQDGGEHVLDCLGLGGRQAGCTVAALAADQARGVVVALLGELEDAVFVAVELVTLLQDVGVDGQPQGHGDESLGRVGARGLVERAAPRRQVVESESRRAGNDTVEFFREVLCSLEALATTSGASEVVRFGVLLAVEALGDLLANSDASFQPVMVSSAQRI